MSEPVGFDERQPKSPDDPIVKKIHELRDLLAKAPDTKDETRATLIHIAHEMSPDTFAAAELLAEALHTYIIWAREEALKQDLK